MIKAGIVALSLLIPVHSWYPIECCSDNDCRPVPCDELQEQADGSVKYRDSLVFSKNQVKVSQDSNCHVCHIGDKTYCVFIVPSA